MARRPKDVKGKSLLSPTLEALSTREGVETRMADLPRQVSGAVAARAALRVLPLLVHSKTSTVISPDLPDLAFSCFHGIALARLLAKDPTRYAALRRDIAAIGLNIGSFGSTEGDAADLAAFAATAATRVAARIFPADAAQAVNASTLAARAAAGSAARGTAARAATARAAASDLMAFMNGGHTTFEDAPLWPEGAPDWALDATLRLFAELPSDQYWGVWRDWYEERIRGGSRGAENEIVFATVPDSERKKGAAAANRWIAKHLPKPPAKKRRQRAALHEFGEKRGRIVLAPKRARATDPASTQDLLLAARQRLADLRERLRTVQDDKHLIGALDALEAVLPENLGDLRIGRLADAYLALEADCRAYDTEEGRAQHTSDLIAKLLRLRNSTRAVVGRFKQGRAILAEQAELDLTEKPGAVAVAESETAAIAETAAKHPEAVDPPAAAALLDPAQAIAASRDPLERTQHVSLRLVTHLNFLSKLADLADKAIGAAKQAGAATRGALRTAASEVGGLAADSWAETRKQAPKKVGAAAAESMAKGVKRLAAAATVGATIYFSPAVLDSLATSAERIAHALGVKGEPFKEIADALKVHAQDIRAAPPASEPALPTRVNPFELPAN